MVCGGWKWYCTARYLFFCCLFLFFIYFCQDWLENYLFLIFLQIQCCLKVAQLHSSYTLSFELPNILYILVILKEPSTLNPPPNSPKESESSTILSITYQGHFLFYPPSFIPIPPLQVFFQNFSLQLPPMSKDLVGIRNKSSETLIPSKNQISLRSDHLFVRQKYPNFHVFQEFRFPPPTPPNVTGSGQI